MEGAGTRLNVVILDACRNNPFGGLGLRSIRERAGADHGARRHADLVCDPAGQRCARWDGGNSPYTRALAETLPRPGLGIFDVFNEVGLAVKRATGGAQQPWVSSSPIAGTFTLPVCRPHRGTHQRRRSCELIRMLPHAATTSSPNGKTPGKPGMRSWLATPGILRRPRATARASSRSSRRRSPRRRRPTPRRSRRSGSSRRHPGVPVVARARARAQAEGKLQGMRRLSRDGGGAGGIVHHGLAGERGGARGTMKAPNGG